MRRRARILSATGTMRKPDQCGGRGIFADGKAGGVERHGLFQRETALQRPRLRGSPRHRSGSAAGACRSRRPPPPEVTGVDLPRAPALAGAATSSESRAPPSARRPAAGPCGYPGWCRRRIRSDRSPSGAPCGRPASRSRRRSQAPSAFGVVRLARVGRLGKPFGEEVETAPLRRTGHRLLTLRPHPRSGR